MKRVAMKTRTTLRSLGILCLLSAAVIGCKKSEDTTTPTVDIPLVNEGIVFREGFSEQTIPGRVEANVEASSLADHCVGFISEEPVAEVTFDGNIPVRVHVVAEEDTVLVVTHGDNVECNDNFDLMHPSIHKEWAAGSYAFYVGTRTALSQPFEYDLNFDHYDPRQELTGRPLPEAAAEERSAEERSAGESEAAEAAQKAGDDAANQVKENAQDASAVE